MILLNLQNSSIEQMNSSAGVFFCACGYESRSAALAPQLGPSIRRRIAVGFAEHSDVLARCTNESLFRDNDFQISVSAANDLESFTTTLRNAITAAIEQDKPIAIDISSMTRAWHGATIRAIVEENRPRFLETYFIYTPGVFQPPPKVAIHNEIVAPVEGFSSLTTPAFPVALVLGLGYERERALGLNQLLDPGKTVLLIPRHGNGDDLYYPQVRQSNADLIREVTDQWIYEYPLGDPVASFGILESICNGLQRDYRVVVASLGPKLFGIISFLVATKNRDISIWRASSGVHAKPRDIKPENRKVVIFKAVWASSQNR